MLVWHGVHSNSVHCTTCVCVRVRVRVRVCVRSVHVCGIDVCGIAQVQMAHHAPFLLASAGQMLQYKG